MNMIFTRPPAVRAIALAYLLSPLGNVLQASLMSGDHYTDVLGKALYGFGTAGALLVLAGPIAGIGIYSGKRWGFVAFFVHAFALLVDSAIRLSSGSFGYKASILLVDLAVLVAVSIVLREDIRAPFLSEVERGWRLGRRMPATGTVRVSLGSDSVEVPLVNISTTGVLVKWVGDLPVVGAKGTIAFTVETGSVELPAGVVRSTAEGVAFGFMEPAWTSLSAVLRAVVEPG